MLDRSWDSIDREWRNSKRAVLAYYIGGWREGESPADALARALEMTSESSEIDRLSRCLGADLIDFSELSFQQSIALSISLLNEKLEDVPHEVRDFFGAPRELAGVARAATRGIRWDSAAVC